MVKHIVVWKMLEEAEGADKHENALKMKALLESLKDRIPGVIRLEVGIDFTSAAGSGDIALYMEFADRAALDAYKEHPEHQHAAEIIRSVVAEHRIVDYEI